MNSRINSEEIESSSFIGVDITYDTKSGIYFGLGVEQLLINSNYQGLSIRDSLTEIAPEVFDTTRIIEEISDLNQYRHTLVPVTIGYSKSYKGFSAFGEISPFFTLIKQFSGSITSEFDEEFELFNTATDVPLVGPQFTRGMKLGWGARYLFREKYGLWIRTSYQFYFDSFPVLDGTEELVNHKVTITGTHLGLSYKF